MSVSIGEEREITLVRSTPSHRVRVRISTAT